MIDEIWVFNGAGNPFSSGVFSSREHAEEWITQYGLTGVLTKYPVDVDVYNWAIENGFSNQKMNVTKHHNLFNAFLPPVKNTITMKMVINSFENR